jgi:hypothetical protein
MGTVSSPIQGIWNIRPLAGPKGDERASDAATDPMQISTKLTIAAVAAAAAVCAPAGAYAHGGHGNGHGQRGADSHGPRWQTVVATGTVVSVDSDVVTIQVRRANHHGRALRNQQVQLDLASARVRVKDVNGDGARDVADVAAGDRVVAQVRVPRGTTVDLTQPIAARKFVDVGPKPSRSSDDSDNG